MPVARLNINVTPEFEAALARYMRARGIATRSGTIRRAVAEALERAIAERAPRSWGDLLGAAVVGPENPSRRFRSDDGPWG
jgi:hypothetical protein